MCGPLRTYLLWVELEAATSRFAGIDPVSSGCTDSVLQPTHRQFSALPTWRDKGKEFRMFNVWVKMKHCRMAETEQLVTGRKGLLRHVGVNNL
jgi:hypothetical protein